MIMPSEMIRPVATPVTVNLRIYVAGDATNSAQAIANLRAICREHLPDRHTIEIVDVFRNPDRALTDRVFLTPTLIRVAPLPERRIVGTLRDTEIVLRSLELDLRP